MLKILYERNRSWPYKIHRAIDVSDKLLVKVYFRPDAWAATAVYEKTDEWADVVMPTTFKGLYFRIKRPGKSGATDPFTGTYKEGDEIVDGAATWEAVDYDLLETGVTVSACDFTATQSVTLASESAATTTAQCLISAIPTTVTEFDVTGHPVLSNAEEFDMTFAFKVNPR